MLAAAWGFCFFATLLTFIRWWFLIRALGIPCRFRDSIRISFWGYLFNLAPLGIVGGDLVKAVMLDHEHRGYRAKAVASVFADRVIGLYVLFLVATVAILLTGYYWEVAAVPDLRPDAITPNLGHVRHHAGQHVGAGGGHGPRRRRGGRRLGDRPDSPRRAPAEELARRRADVSEQAGRARPFIGNDRRRPLLVRRRLFLHRLRTAGQSPLAGPTLRGHAAQRGDASDSRADRADRRCLGVPLPLHAARGRPIIEGQGLVVALVYRIITLLIAALGIPYYFGNRREMAEVIHEAEEE